MITQWRKTALAGSTLLVAATLTSCLRVDMDLELDGATASGEVVLAVSQEVLDMTGGDSSDVFDTTDVPEGATVEPYEEDGFVGQRVTFEDTAISEFDDPESVTITYDEEAGRYEVGGVMDFSTDGGGIGDIPPGMAESFDVSVSVTFPGEVIEHNGELDGTTVTWTPQLGEATEFSAVAEDSGGASGGPAWLWVSLAVVAALLVIGLLVFFARRRGQPGAHDGDAAAVPGGDAAGDAAPDDVTRDLSRDAGSGETRDLSAAAEGADQETPRDSGLDDATRDLSGNATDGESTDAADRGPDDQR